MTTRWAGSQLHNEAKNIKRSTLTKQKCKILELHKLRMTAFAKTSRQDQTRKTPGLFSLKEKPRDIHLSYPTKNKKYKQWKAVTGSHVALAKSRGVLEIKGLSPKSPKSSGKPVSVFKPSAEIERKGGKSPPHTWSCSELWCTIVVACIIGDKLNKNLLKCPEPAVVLYKPLSMNKNLNKQLWKPKKKNKNKNKRPKQNPHILLKDFFGG